MIHDTRTWCPIACLLVTAMCAAWPASGQTGRSLSREEAEAQEMGLQMAVACNPRRHREAIASESTIRRTTGALSGTAILSRSAEGTFLSLEQYDESLEGHCLVFGWFGGELAAGRYPIIQLSSLAVEQEQASGDRSFYSWGAVRTGTESSMVMARSGALDIVAVAPGKLTGTFELSGFVVEGTTLVGDETWSGAFTAVEMR